MCAKNMQRDSGLAFDDFSDTDLALLLYFRIKSSAPQTFLVAGTDDLRAITHRLHLDKPDDEAYLLFHSANHTFAIYFRTKALKPQCILFTKNMKTNALYFQAIISTIQLIPNIEIYVHESQQSHPPIYSIQCLEQLRHYGQLISTEGCTVIGDFKNVYSFNDDKIPQIRQLPDYKRNLAVYIQNNCVVEAKIIDIVRELRGFNARPNSSYLTKKHYNIFVSVCEPGITFIFENEAAFLHNILVTADKGGLTPKVLLADHRDLQVTVNTKLHQISYKAKNLKIIENAFVSLCEGKMEPSAVNIQQHLGLISIIWSVVEAIELTRIPAFDGGIDQNYIQLALKYLLQDKPKVYVPAVSELSGEEAVLSLENLKEQGYEHIVFSMDVDPTHRRRHQVAACIDLSVSPLKITTYNSYTTFKVNEKVLAKLCGDANYVVVEGESPEQLEFWACGIYVIENCLAHVKGIKPTNLKELDKASQYFRAFQYQRELETTVELQSVFNFNCKRNLLDILVQNCIPETQCLHDFMQIEIWGNLAIKAQPRPNNSTEERRNRSLLACYNDYFQRYKDEPGNLLLRLALIEDNVERINNTINLLPIIENARSAIIAAKKEIYEIDKVAIALSAEVNSYLTKDMSVDEQLSFLKYIIRLLSSRKDVLPKINILLKKLDCEFYKDNNKFNIFLNDSIFCGYIIYSLLQKVTITTLERDKDYKSELNRIENKRIAKEIECNKRIIKIKEKLCKIIPDATEAFYLEIAQHTKLCQFIANYFTDDFLDKIPIINRMEYVRSMLPLLQAADIDGAIAFYQGNDMLGHIRKWIPEMQWSYFLKLFAALPNFRVNLLTEYKDIIKTHEQILSLVPMLNQNIPNMVNDDRTKVYSFFMGYTFFITNIDQLIQVLQRLGQDEYRIMIAIKYRHVVKGYAAVLKVRQSVPYIGELKEYVLNEFEIFTDNDLRACLGTMVAGKSKDYIACVLRHRKLLLGLNTQAYITLISPLHSKKFMRSLISECNTVEDLASYIKKYPFLEHNTRLASYEPKNSSEFVPFLKLLNRNHVNMDELLLKYHHFVNTENLIDLASLFGVVDILYVNGKLQDLNHFDPVSVINTQRIYDTRYLQYLILFNLIKFEHLQLLFRRLQAYEPEFDLIFANEFRFVELFLNKDPAKTSGYKRELVREFPQLKRHLAFIDLATIKTQDDLVNTLRDLSRDDYNCHKLILKFIPQLIDWDITKIFTFLSLVGKIDIYEKLMSQIVGKDIKVCRSFKAIEDHLEFYKNFVKAKIIHPFEVDSFFPDPSPANGESTLRNFERNSFQLKIILKSYSEFGTSAVADLKQIGFEFKDLMKTKHASSLMILLKNAELLKFHLANGSYWYSYNPVKYLRKLTPDELNKLIDLLKRSHLNVSDATNNESFSKANKNISIFNKDKKNKSMLNYIINKKP